MPKSESSILQLMRQRALLELEYQAEREQFKQHTEQVGIGRMVKRGDCWWPVTVGRSRYNSLNQPVVELTREADTDIEHNFEFGRQVVFFNIDEQNNIRYLHVKAQVSYAEPERMVLALNDIGDATTLAAAESLGVQLSFDETSYRLMREALNRVAEAKNNRLAELREMFYHPAHTARFTFESMRFPWLNEAQEHAVNEVLKAKDVSIVHGPPGTGKTTTLVEAIHETLMRESQVLVCAQSNMAVDWISEKLMDRGIDVLRIGNPSRVNDKMLSFTYERRFEAHPDYPQLWAIRKAIRELKGARKRGNRNNYHQKLDRLNSRAVELEVRIKNELFSSARVIACTLVSSANRVLEGMKFGTLFVDEAAQALEAACWIAIRRVHRVVLAGDHKQLPPTIKSFDALKAGLDKTLMERIVENNPQVVNMLTVQYRMNDDIMRFSSHEFYHDKVKSHSSVRHRSILDLDTPIVWVDTAGMDFREQFVGENYGRVNRHEAELTLDTLERYFERVGKKHIIDERIDVGVISPYRAQVQYLRRLFRKRQYFKPFRSLISVGTVDGFQGQERDIIVISLVRANDEGQIGFLNDLRRMNVAITRARMKLIILGDSETMTRHPFYNRLYQYITNLNTHPKTDI